jgi:hypothetical protein
LRADFLFHEMIELIEIFIIVHCWLGRLDISF